MRGQIQAPSVTWAGVEVRRSPSQRGYTAEGDGCKCFRGQHARLRAVVLTIQEQEMLLVQLGQLCQCSVLLGLFYLAGWFVSALGL